MRALLLPGLLLSLMLPAHAQDVAANSGDASAPAQVFEAVVVSGVQPGPGLWRVTKGDNVMWILGTLSPLPKRIEWEAREVRQVIAESQQVLTGARVKLKEKIGFFRGLTLLPAALSSRKNPGKEKLADQVPPDTYQRWLALKKRYIGRSSSIEKQRPLFAAQKLWEKAVKRNGLSFDGVVDKVIIKTARQHDVPMVSAEVEIDIGDPRQAIRDFANDDLDDLKCFTQTLDRLETDLVSMRERANAWATGDIEALRALPFEDQNRACADAVLQAGVARKRGLDDLRQRVRRAWMEAAEKALAQNRVTFAILPMGELLKPDGFLAALRQRGYEVEEP